MVAGALRRFLGMEAASGVLLVVAAALGMLCANTPLAPLYETLLSLTFEVRGGTLSIAKPLLLWINDGLMAVFFLLVGLEIKREVLEGELSSPSQIVLPALAAVGGMAVPGLVYAAFNWGDPAGLEGWAIPTATDIAFALGVLALLGDRVPHGLKVFLLTLAILDDLGAIVVIAVFYTAGLSAGSLAVAAAALLALALLNRRNVTALTPYLLLGIVLWASVLKSGVHATLAGVALALFVPLRVPPGAAEPPLHRLEHDLHPAVAFAIVPIFAFANAGVPLGGLSLAALSQPVPAGIAAGLFIGKPLGVFGVAWLAIRCGLARMPEGATWSSLYGVAMLCGIGFTMSLFIGSLAFEHAAVHTGGLDRLGILLGSLVSALAGYALLAAVLPRTHRGG